MSQNSVDRLLTRRRVPIVGLSGKTIATKQIDRFGDLVRALGVDTGADELVRARAAFDNAAEHLSRVARRKSRRTRPR
jgi:hypothetical protein